jgi:hypothetical protein
MLQDIISLYIILFTILLEGCPRSARDPGQPGSGLSEALSIRHWEATMSGDLRKETI